MGQNPSIPDDQRWAPLPDWCNIPQIVEDPTSPVVHEQRTGERDDVSPPLLYPEPRATPPPLTRSSDNNYRFVSATALDRHTDAADPDAPPAQRAVHAPEIPPNPPDWTARFTLPPGNPERTDRPIVDPETDPIVADPLHENWYWTTGAYTASEWARMVHYRIYPGHRPGKQWSLDELLVFLNELDDYWQISDCCREYHSKKHPENGYVRFTLKRLPQPGVKDPGNIWVFAPVDSTKHEFSVQVAKDWLAQESWLHSEVVRQTYQPPDHLNRPPLKVERVSTYFYPFAITRNASKSLKRGDLLGILEQNDVSAPFAYFVSKMRSFEGLSAHRRLYLDHLWSVIAPVRAPIRPVLTSASFERYDGFLTLILEPRRLGARLEPWSLASELQSHSIVGGLFIHSCAASILQHRHENRIAGLMMDTTWSVMRQYVTSILVGVSRNTAIPLGFAFGPAETTELYEQFYTGFLEHGVNLSEFIIESDQGPALISFCQKHMITQRFCLHHVLRTLKDPVFAVCDGDGVRARSDFEPRHIMDRCSAFFGSAFGGVQVPLVRDLFLTRARKRFKKAGLGLADTYEIVIAAQARWEQVSMRTRVREDMPPTTNCSEDYSRASQRINRAK
jgi:hypothetical protein